MKQQLTPLLTLVWQMFTWMIKKGGYVMDSLTHLDN